MKKILQFFKTFPITILTIILIVLGIAYFLYGLYSSEGYFVKDRLGETYFVDRNHNKITDAEVKYKNEKYYVDLYGYKICDNFVKGKYYTINGKLLHDKFFNVYGETYYFDKNGDPISNSFITVDDKKYFMDEYGCMKKNQWVLDKYFVDENGVMLKNTIVPDGSHVDENGEYYFVNEYDIDYKNLKFGDIITFGKYKQKKIGYEYKDQDETHYEDNPIEWIVLENKNGILKLMSKYVLDQCAYNEKSVDTNWEYSGLRKWLHNSFIKKAFSKNDCDVLVEYENENKGNSIYGIKPSKNTKDKVCVLSKEELLNYYGYGDMSTGINTKIQTEPTAYASKEPLYISNGFTNYWLRNEGYDKKNAMNVQFCGVIDNQGVSICAKNIGVRPVIYVDFSKGLKK